MSLLFVKSSSDLIYSLSQHCASIVNDIRIVLSFIEIIAVMSLDSVRQHHLKRFIDDDVENLYVIDTVERYEERYDVEILENLFDLRCFLINEYIKREQTRRFSL